MDGFRVVKLNEVIRQVDVIITCTGNSTSNRAGVNCSFGNTDVGLHYTALLFILLWHNRCLLVYWPLRAVFRLDANFIQRCGQWLMVSLRREQERGNQRPAGPHEKWLYCLQHGPLQYWDWCGKLCYDGKTKLNHPAEWVVVHFKQYS